MQRFKNSFFCWLVILAVFLRPSPAQAAIPLAAVAVGAAIAATGVMVAGAGVYKPPTFAQANAAVDSVTGDINRKVVVARMFGAGVSAGLRGFQSSYTLDFNKVMDWIKSNPSSYPTLSPAATAATSYSTSTPRAIGAVHPYAGSNYKISSVGAVSQKHGNTNYRLSQFLATYTVKIGGCYVKAQSTTQCTLMWDPYEVYNDPLGYPNAWTCWWTEQTVYYVPTTDPPTTYPETRNPGAFAAAYPNTQAGQDETDKIATDNPSAIKQPPAAMTSEQVAEASKQAGAQSAEATAQAAEAAAAADPNNTALQVAAQQAREAANQAAIAADAAKGELETKPDDPPKEDIPPSAGPAPDADLTIDFSPFLGLQNKALSKFPFSVVSSLGSLFSGLTSSPVTPSMEMPMPWGIPSKTISLSAWDGAAAKFRLAIALFFHGACMYAIIRRYS